MKYFHLVATALLTALLFPNINLFASPSQSVPGDTIHINFSNELTVPPSPYLRDFGEPFGTRGEHNYGWVVPGTNTPISLVGNGRNRSPSPDIDVLRETLMHMQYGDTGGSLGPTDEGAWEISLPNGTYRITVVAGDSEQESRPGTTHVVNAENVNLVYQPTVYGGINQFSGRGVVDVTDGRLTLDAIGGYNSKISSVVIAPAAPEPVAFFSNVIPANGATDVPTSGFQISVAVNAPEGYELDKNSIYGRVRLFEQTDIGLIEVSSNSNDTGGGDAITLTTASALKPATTYVFHLEGVKANRIGDVNDHITFRTFTSQFSSAAGEDTNPPVNLDGVSFTQISGSLLGAGTAGRFTSLVIGPDKKLYASSLGKTIKRWTILPDGTLTNLEELSIDLRGSAHPVTGVLATNDRLIIGLAFAPESTPTNLIAYVTHSATTLTDGPEWDGKLTRLSGPQLQNVQDVLIHLPRSRKDHLTNSVVFGPAGDLFILQGSNSAGGEPDGAWGMRIESLLSAAVLRLRPNKLPPTLPLSVYTTADISVINAAPASGLLMNDGTYNPYSLDAPLTLYATGIRNAYDLVFHSNGWMYIPTNGTAGNNSNTPNTPASIGYVSQDTTGVGVRRPNGTYFTDPTVPGIVGGETQKDWLFKTKGGSYHGHPNPYRGEFVLNHGGQEYTGLPGQLESTYRDVSKYPTTLGPDMNYQEVAFDFAKNKSPNGVIEYKSNAFGGKLRGMILVARFSGQDDIMVLQPGNNSGEILQAFEDIPGLQSLDDPLELVEDPTTGNLYVAQYDRDGGGQQKILLMRVADPAVPVPVIVATPDELILEAAVFSENSRSDSKKIDISNTGEANLHITSRSISGPYASQFNIIGPTNITLSPNSSQEYTINYFPTRDQNALGYQPSELVFNSDGNQGAPFRVGLHALKTTGTGGTSEPSLQTIANVLGIDINVGWNSLAGSTDPALQGDEVNTQFFQANGNGAVTLTPVARYSPAESLPFGYYSRNGGSVTTFQTGVLAASMDEAQTLYPQLVNGTLTLTPGGDGFGIYLHSNYFNRKSYTEDNLNTGIARRSRIYPMRDRDGRPVEGSYLVCFEDDANGDYQDYVFVLSNVEPYRPIASQPNFSARINFQDASFTPPIGYRADYGAPYGARGDGFTYGWIDPFSKLPTDNTSGARGATRGVVASSSTDEKLRWSFNHFDRLKGHSTVQRDWEIAVPNGLYRVQITVGDRDSLNSRHTVRAEGITVIEDFAPYSLSSFRRDGLATVEVKDGKLTIDDNGAQGIGNSKIMYVHIDRLADVAPTGARLRFENMTKAPGTNQGFPADDYFTFYRSQITYNGKGTELIVHDKNVVRIHNAGTSPLIINRLTTTNTKHFVISGISIPASGLTVNPGQFVDATVTFIRNDGQAKVLVTEKLILETNADNGATANVTLRGGYVYIPEGSGEISAQQVFNAFGFTTRMGRDATGEIVDRPSSEYPPDAAVNNGLEGDMILSNFFVQANPNQPIRMIQLSALHGPGGAPTELRDANFQVVGEMKYNHGDKHHQTLLPKSTDVSNIIAGKQVAAINVPFQIMIAGYSTRGGTTTGSRRDEILGLRVYRALDRNGNVIPNAYILNQDYVGDGCGVGTANCDWQDNTSYILNVRPVGVPSATTIADYSAPAQQTTSYNVTSSFKRGYAGNVLDYTAMLTGGAPLPTWMKLGLRSGAFSFTPPSTAVGNVYTIQVKVTDGNGLTATSSFKLTITAGSGGGGGTTNENPIAVASASPTSGTAPLAVTLDGSSSIDHDGSITQYAWAWNGGSATGPTPQATFAAGSYTVTLTVTDNLGAKASDVVSIQASSAPPPPPPPPGDVANVHWLEAECATVGSNWRTINDANASGGKYVVFPSGNSTTNPPNDAPENRIRFTINAESGTYHLFARVDAANGYDDSFWVRINGGSWFNWNSGFAQGVGFAWNKMPGTLPTLTGGVNTIDFAYREDGAKFDKLYLSKSGTEPTGMGNTATNCSDSPPPPPPPPSDEQASIFWLEAECATVGSNWRTVNDATASSGKYVVFPSGNSTTNPPNDAPENRIRFTVNAEAGTYNLFARVDAANGSDDSFWVRINGGSWYNWNSGFTQGVGFVWNKMPGTLPTLTGGVNTIDFAYREDGAKFDKLYLSKSGTEPTGMGNTATNCGDSTPPPPPPSDDQASTFWLEAECATVGSNWVTTSNAAASAGKYVVFPSGNSTTNPPNDAPENRIRFTVNAEAGTYHLFARVDAANGSDDSFWVRINGGGWYNWNSGFTQGVGFAWNKMTGSLPALIAGTNTIDFAYREDGTKLDKMYLSKSSTAPSGLGNPASNCTSSATAFTAASTVEPAEEVNLYPNPATDELTISVIGDYRGEVSLYLTDVHGRNIRQQFFSKEDQTLKVELRIADLPAGIYRMLLLEEDRRTIRTFIKL